MRQFIPEAHPLKPVDTTYPIALAAAQAADDRKGGNIVLLDVTPISTLADYFLIVTGYSNTQVRAIVKAIEDRLLEDWHQTPLRIEGLQAASWILMDYADIIVHVMLQEERDYYDLDTFWGEAHPVELQLAS